MRIAREGIPFVLAAAVLTAVVWLLGWSVPALVLLLATGFVAFFFRDPERMAPGDPDAVLAPGDGRVVAVESVGSSTRISIFLSLFDVHVNRSPVAGVVQRVEHRPGRFRAAFHDLASSENERTEVVIAGDRGPVVFRQIAGLIARRIVCRLRPGQSVSAGERVGLIRFGSRVDLQLEGRVEATVVVGEKVRGGVSVVARYRRAEAER